MGSKCDLQNSFRNIQTCSGQISRRPTGPDKAIPTRSCTQRLRPSDPLRVRERQLQIQILPSGKDIRRVHIKVNRQGLSRSDI